MEEYDFATYDSGPGNELERRRRKRKKVRLWLGQPKRFDLVKKGVKVRGRKKKLQETKPSGSASPAVSIEMCTTEDAMAAAILLQMSSHGGHSDQNREYPFTWKEEESRHFPRPKGPSWIVDHDYAIQPHKYGSHKPDYYKTKSGTTKSRRTVTANTDTYREPCTDRQIVEQTSFTAQEDNERETLITWRNSSNQNIIDENEESNSVWYPADHLDSSMESDTILHLSEGGEILKLSRSENSAAETSTIDVAAVLDGMKGDVEYKTVVITDDDDNIIHNWNENVTYGNSESEVDSGDQKNKNDVEQLCRRCHQQLDPLMTGGSDTQPSTSTSQEPAAICREQPSNAPDVIPMSVEGGILQGSRLSEDAHQSVREISNLSEDLVRNLEDANMLENFMVLFRTIAAGYVPDLSECDDLKSMKSGVNRLPVGITSNG